MRHRWKLDVRTAMKSRMLVFEVCEEVNEELARESGTVPGWTYPEQNGTCWVKTGSQPCPKSMQTQGDVFLQPHHSLQGCVSCCRVLRLAVKAVASVCGVCGILPCDGWRGSVCSPAREHAERQDHLETHESHTRHTCCYCSLAKVGALLCDGHWRVLTCVPCCFKH